MPPPSDLSPTGDPARLSLKQGLWFAVGTGLLYVLAVWFNRSVLQAQDLFTGVALFFLPAGVKLMALLIGRQWGALGLLVSNFVMSLFEWQGVPVPMLLLMSAVWVGVTWAVVETLLRTMRLPADLSGLRFSHFIVIDAAAAILHAFAFNGLLLQSGLRAYADYLNAVWGMALGDFLGSGAFALMVLGVGVMLRRLWQSPHRR
jgi:hypothetical protein